MTDHALEAVEAHARRNLATARDEYGDADVANRPEALYWAGLADAYTDIIILIEAVDV